MEARITLDGNLELKRRGAFRPQMCPFISGGRPFPKCGDHCPLFDEARFDETEEEKAALYLNCGDGSSRFLIIEDERPEPPPTEAP